ncbi:ZmpA/ZmpB/ZmpC family metallo-endopeptidase [Mesomycoplasma hyorhinis]|uniref:ZmpA/ZmpB/ZmpC family metallo-endopeptidase n=1 Tax=Mesomycoplasma hyorhinis TaxID=2100 RepID=UPI001C05B2EB|nr:ZmpA/ZmpB/ZmpC family metallo-endopeptidase [Mesomycoplasma hyorhinis]
MYKNKKRSIWLLSSVFTSNSLLITSCASTEAKSEFSEQDKKEIEEKNQQITDLKLQIENIKIKLQNASKQGVNASINDNENEKLKEQIAQLQEQIKILEVQKQNELMKLKNEIDNSANQQRQITKKNEAKINKLNQDKNDLAKKNSDFFQILKNDELYKNFDQVSYSPTLFNDSQSLLSSSKYLLENSFEQEKLKIKEILSPILAQDILINTKSNVTVENYKDKIIKNKSKILLALSYIRKWYDFNIGDFNFRKFILYDNPNLHTENKSILEFLIQIGSKPTVDYEPQNLINFYNDNLKNIIDPNKDFFDFIESKVKDKFQNISVETWFNQQISQFLYQPEIKLFASEKEVISTKTSLWTKLTSDKFKSQFSHLIPTLLTARNQNSGLFVVNTIGAVIFGNQKLYDSLDLGLDRISDNNDLKIKLKKFGDRLEGFFEFYYNLISKNFKDKLFNKLFIFDSLWEGKNSWLSQEKLLDKTKPASYDFFSVIDYWGSSFESNQQNTTLNKSEDVMKLIQPRFLTELGIQNIIKEITNNLKDIIFENHKVRKNVKEQMLDFDFAKYLFDSRFFIGLTSVGPDSEIGKLSYQTINYSNLEDLQKRWKHAMELVYTLENIEADLKLNLTKNSNNSNKTEENKAKLFLKVSTDQNSNNKFSTVEQSEINSITTMEQLVDRDYVSSWGYTPDDNNNSDFDLFTAFYGTADKENGITGTFSMRRISFELLAEFGWEEGIINYLTNKLNKNNDAETIKAIFSAKTYNNLKDFKKAMYKQNKEKQNKLKEVEAKGFTNKYKLEKLNYNTIKKVLSEALEYDLSINITSKNSYNNLRDSYFYVYKRQIFSSYYIATNGFKDSIYKDE